MTIEDGETYYDQISQNQTEWDDGETLWDISGNVYATDWDIQEQTWTEQ